MPRRGFLETRVDEIGCRDDESHDGEPLTDPVEILVQNELRVNMIRRFMPRTENAGKREVHVGSLDIAGSTDLTDPRLVSIMASVVSTVKNYHPEFFRCIPNPDQPVPQYYIYYSILHAHGGEEGFVSTLDTRDQLRLYATYKWSLGDKLAIPDYEKMKDGLGILGLTPLSDEDYARMHKQLGRFSDVLEPVLGAYQEQMSEFRNSTL